jgi:hypothetical protein
MQIREDADDRQLSKLTNSLQMPDAACLNALIASAFDPAFNNPPGTVYAASFSMPVPSKLASTPS